jgi:hypothetical protein
MGNFHSSSISNSQQQQQRRRRYHKRRDEPIENRLRRQTVLVNVSNVRRAGSVVNLDTADSLVYKNQSKSIGAFNPSHYPPPAYTAAHLPPPDYRRRSLAIFDFNTHQDDEYFYTPQLICSQNQQNNYQTKVSSTHCLNRAAYGSAQSLSQRPVDPPSCVQYDPMTMNKQASAKQVQHTPQQPRYHFGCMFRVEDRKMFV